MSLSDKAIADIFLRTSAHRKGHFLLSSGLHSADYLQCALVLEHPAEAEALGAHIAEMFRDQRIAAVVGPALGGILPAYVVARALGVRAMYCERDKAGAMVLRRDFQIVPGERILVAEDVVTTGKSTREVIAALPGPPVIVACVALADRSGGVDLGVPLRAAFRASFATYPPEACPLCRDGLPLVKPGSRPGPA
ncbi:MAG: orotate phosphoribosyltransferase [Planctomycetota bacterium]